jgi:hypothetical protein
MLKHCFLIVHVHIVCVYDHYTNLPMLFVYPQFDYIYICLYVNVYCDNRLPNTFINVITRPPCLSPEHSWDRFSAEEK